MTSNQTLSGRFATRGMLCSSLVTLALLAGCETTTIDSLAPYRPVPMTDAPVAPKIDPANAARRVRVVVFPTEEAANARGFGLHNVAASTMESVLGVGGIEVVDRSLATRLDDELKRAEMAGSGSYSGTDVADFAIKVVMGNASWGTQFVEAQQFTDRRSGKVTTIPASHTHSARSEMTIRIYEVPSLRLVQSVRVLGSMLATGQNRAAGPADAPGLMRAATERGLGEKRADVLNELAAKGYVVERRVKDKASIFRVMLGKHTGAKTGDAVEIYTLERNVNPLTKQVSYDQLKVASGRVSNILGDAESWVVVADAKEADAVRRGDIAKVAHRSGGMFGNLMQAVSR